MQLKFSKMHGAGNDFVIFDGISQNVRLTPEQVRFIADRRFGIGCDQVLLAERPAKPETDFAYRIFNADGGEVEQCGNGARCFARFVREHGLSGKDELSVETASGIIRLYLEAGGRVRVNMGKPRFTPAEIPFAADAQALSYQIAADGREWTIGAVSMGNPHAVLQVEDTDTAPVARLGPLLECHPRFPRRVNAGFMQVLDRTHIRLRVYERGSGETLACGTGACAAAVIGQRRGLLDTAVDVALPGGHVEIVWNGDDEPVWLIGPAVTVFEGVIEL